jgi:hypothetical protein
VPPALRPDPLKLVRDYVRDSYEKFLAGGDPPQQLIDSGAYLPAAHLPEPRIAWMDKRGIDAQIILPSIGYHPYCHAMRNAPELALQTLETYNRWATDRVHGHTGRLIPAAVIDLLNVDWAVAKSRKQEIRCRPDGRNGFPDAHDAKAL